jgi:hypothetical protein
MLDRYMNAYAAMLDYLKAHPGFQERGGEWPADLDPKNIDELFRRARAKSPILTRTVEAAGMSFQDYWETSLVIGLAPMVYQGYITAAQFPEGSVARANVEFLKTNQRVIGAWIASATRSLKAIDR